MTAREKITAAAAAAEWVAYRTTAYGEVEFRKGRHCVWVYFNTRGAVIKGSTYRTYRTGRTGGRNILGQGKAEQVLAQLAV